MKTQHQPKARPNDPVPDKGRPQNKETLDSRQNEEQEFKGDDITHNEKPVKSEKKSTNNKSTNNKSTNNKVNHG